MKTAIRVDASRQIGTGHVMRCLTLAQELRQKGAHVVFVCRDHPGNLCERIESYGFELTKLDFDQESEQYTNSNPLPAHLPWLGADQDTDARQTIEVLQADAPWDWLIVDHYALDQQWETSLRQVTNKIMVIDDIADRKHDCDLLLDQNYFLEPEKRYRGLIPKHCGTLLGPKYALLRPEFREARKFCCMRGNGIARVLVYFGGNDPDNLTGLALEALNSPQLDHLLVEAVIGPNNQHQEQLEEQVSKRPGTRLHIQPDNFIELMLRADLCIGAGGTTTWERLCLSLPSLVITVAENQEPFTAELHRAGFVTWLGRKEDASATEIKDALLSKVNNERILDLFTDSPSPVDGLGALRGAEKICPPLEDKLSLRKAFQDDIDLFYYWANDPVVRANSFRSKPIAWQEHVSWFQGKLKSNRTEMFVLQTDQGLPVGQIRFDIQVEVADIDYSLDPLVRDRGWGKKLLQMGITELKELHPDLHYQGRVKPGNKSSMRCFQAIGFVEELDRGGQCYSLAVLSDHGSWINQYIPDLILEWILQGHSVLWAHLPEELRPGDFCFMLSCGQLISRSILDMFDHNLVVHESDLPQCKGWSPLTWQILEGKDRIPVTLLEAAEKVDSGAIYAQEWMEFQGHELVNELRQKQAEATIRLCRKFVREYPEIVSQGRQQEGEESFYPRRKPEDSRLDPDKSIKEQFNLLRVVDNERYPAWFELGGQKYTIAIKKNCLP